MRGGEGEEWAWLTCLTSHQRVEIVLLNSSEMKEERKKLAALGGL